MKLGIFYIIGSLLWLFITFDIGTQLQETAFSSFDKFIVVGLMVIYSVELFILGILKITKGYYKKRNLTTYHLRGKDPK